jgi:hypothetical protein
MMRIRPIRFRTTTLALPHNLCAHFFLSQGRGIVPALRLRPSLLSGLVQGCRAFGAAIFTNFRSLCFPAASFILAPIFGTELSRKARVEDFLLTKPSRFFKKLYLKGMISFCFSQTKRRKCAFYRVFEDLSKTLQRSRGRFPEGESPS